MQKKYSLNLFVYVFFILIGIYFFIIGFSPVKIETTITQTGIQAHIHKKSMLLPFKNVDIVVPNLKQAVITTFRGYKGRTTYYLELENSDGKQFSVVSISSIEYNSAVLLRNRINDSIKGRYPYKYAIKQNSFIFYGFLFIVICLIGYIKDKKTITNKQQKSKSQQYQTPKRTLEQQIPHVQTQQQKPKSEQEKYKNINSSIIK